MASKATPARLLLVWTATFARTARKFLRRHSDLEGIFEDVLRHLETDPQAPRLRRRRFPDPGFRIPEHRAPFAGRPSSSGTARATG
jgi:hypothetical protein